MLKLKKYVLGKPLTIRLANGEERKAQFAIVELADIIASHDAQTFASSKGYPTLDNGENINAEFCCPESVQQNVRNNARNLQPDRMISGTPTASGTPIIDVNGIVLSGNRRIMALKLAANEHPQNYAAYKKHLCSVGSEFHFKECDTAFQSFSSIEQAEKVSFAMPVLVRIDYDFPMPYDVVEIAKYNGKAVDESRFSKLITEEGLDGKDKTYFEYVLKIASKIEGYAGVKDAVTLKDEADRYLIGLTFQNKRIENVYYQFVSSSCEPYNYFELDSKGNCHFEFVNKTKGLKSYDLKKIALALENLVVKPSNTSTKAEKTDPVEPTDPLSISMKKLEKLNFSIAADVLSEALTTTLPCVSADELRPAMMGICVELKKEGIYFTSTDAHKLASFFSPQTKSNDEFIFIIPPDKAAKIKADLSSKVKTVDFEFVKSEFVEAKNGNSDTIYYTLAAIFNTGNRVEFVAINAKYPEWRAVVPSIENMPISHRMNRLETLVATDAVWLGANKTTNMVTFDFQAGVVTLSGQDLDFSTDGTTTLKLEKKADDLRIGFSGRFMCQILKMFDNQYFAWSMSTPSRAAIIAPERENKDSSKSFFLLMPVNLYN